MVKTIQSSFPPSPNFDRVTESFDKLNNTDILLANEQIKEDLFYFP